MCDVSEDIWMPANARYAVDDLFTEGVVALDEW
jgi:hypothetical protein